MPLNDAQAQFLARLDGGEVFAVTSEIALSECLVKPFADGEQHVIDAYFTLFESQRRLAVLSVTREVLVEAAQLRASLRMSLSDAIHVSTARIVECEVFVTDDRRIRTPAGLSMRSWNEIGVEAK